jgi:uncharacterized protein DUF4440
MQTTSLFRALFDFTILRAAPGVALSQQDCSGTLTAEEAWRAEQARYAAQTSGDFAALERMIGDDLVYIHSSSNVDTKASFIESLRSGAVKYRSMKPLDVKVRGYGCIGIVTGRLDVEVTVRAQDNSLKILFHSVWAKRAAGLQFVSWQATRLP